MEDVKKSFFSSMFAKTQRKPLEFVRVMQDMEKVVRDCYSDSESLDLIDSEAFVKMMILDGCFIVQLFRNEYSSESASFLQLSGVDMEIYYDLVLLENQLPFVVLSKLYGMITGKKDGKDEFVRLALKKLARFGPNGKTLDDNCPGKFAKNIKHLLGLVHDGWLPQDGGTGHGPQNRGTGDGPQNRGTGDGPQNRGTEDGSQDEGTEGGLPNFISCARELDEAGITFVKKENNLVKDENGNVKKVQACLFDIEFTKDAKLMIPTLSIGDHIEVIFRNLVAYEQFIPSSEPSYFCDYVVFMDNLINSSKDVQLLRRSKVIINWLGDDEAVAQMFNKFHEFTYSNKSSFYYAQMYRKVHKHCGKRRNEWKAKLKKDYFSSPWSILSVVAAVVLLLLTVQQSIFSVLSYVHQ